MVAQAPLSRRSLADQVTDALVDYIMSEGLDEGDPLPSTAELSEQFGVSRTVIREALAALAGRGVISRSQGRESLVAQPGPEDLMRLFEFRMDNDRTSLLHILDVRMALEVLAARRAAGNATDDDREALQERMADLRDAKSEAAYHRADIAVHRAIATASGNPMLVLILDSLVEFLRQVRVTATKARKGRGEPLEPMIRQHQEIVDAIIDGDADAAADGMRDHLEATRAELAHA